MRQPLTTGRIMLAERLKRPAQVDGTAFESEMPPYMESLLAHLRLLIGVPFEYLVPDPRLLPDESIRFFYLDRSWTDRLVDGAIAVGKIGSREQAHHHAQNAKVAQADTGSVIVWPIWDEVTTAYLLGLAKAETRPRPRLRDDLSFDLDNPRGTIDWITTIDEGKLWSDLHAKIRAGGG